MSLEVMTILCRCENIETLEGVPLDVTGVAQVMHFNIKKAVAAGARGQRKTQEKGSTNKLTMCLLLSSSLLFSSAGEGTQSAVTYLGCANKAEL